MTNDGNQPPFDPSQPPVTPPAQPQNPPQYSEQYSYQQPNLQVDANGYPIGYPAPAKKSFPLWIPLVIVGVVLIGVAVWLFMSKGTNPAGNSEAHEILSETTTTWATQEELQDYEGWGLWITTNENCSSSVLKVNIYEEQDSWSPVKTLDVNSGSFVAGTEKKVEFTEPEGYIWAEPAELWCTN